MNIIYQVMMTHVSVPVLAIFLLALGCALPSSFLICQFIGMSLLRRKWKREDAARAKRQQG